MAAQHYAVAPGMYLEEWLEDEGLTQSEAADRLGVSRKTVNGIVKGKQPISQETAIRLGRVTGIPADAWARYEAKYRSDLAAIEDEKRLGAHADAICPQLASYLRANHVTTATAREPGRLVSDFLALVGVGTFDAYKRLESETLGLAVSTLREASKDVDPASFMAWIAMGRDTESMRRATSTEYSEPALRDKLGSIRARVAKTDSDTLKDVAAMLAEAGVVLQFVEAPDRFPLHGMTMWTRDGNPVIQMTGRRKKDGYIVWTLFHELGHVLCDQRRGITVERDTKSRRNEEKAANKFAESELLGPNGMEPYRGMSWPDEIRLASERQGVCPGVVVNLMHRMKMLEYSWCSELLVDMAIPAA